MTIDSGRKENIRQAFTTKGQGSRDHCAGAGSQTSQRKVNVDKTKVHTESCKNIPAMFREWLAGWSLSAFLGCGAANVEGYCRILVHIRNVFVP